MAYKMMVLLEAASAVGGLVCGTRGMSAFRVGELPSAVSIIIGTTGALVYSSSKLVGEGAQELIRNGTYELGCCLVNVVVIRFGWGLCGLAVWPIRWSSFRLPLHCSCCTLRLALYFVILRLVSS